MVPMNRDGFYPEVSHAIETITNARLEGKEFAKRRPATLLRVLVAVDGRHIAVEIKPQISSSPSGWYYSGKATIHTIDMAGRGRGNKGKIERGKVRITSWFIRSDRAEGLNRLYSTAIWQAMDTIAADPINIISSQEDNCGICGKGLTDDASRRRGIGPECWTFWNKVHAEFDKESNEFLDDLLKQIAECRRQMQKFHPDKADGDQEQFLIAKARFDEVKERVELLAN